MGKGCVCRNLVSGAKVNRELGEYDISYCVPFSSFVLLIPNGRCWWFLQGFSKVTVIVAQRGSPSLAFFLGSRCQGHLPGKQEGGWPGEDVHHLQQRQGLATTPSSRCGPERKPHALLTGQLSHPMWRSQGRLLPWGYCFKVSFQCYILGTWSWCNVGRTGLQTQITTPTEWNPQWIAWVSFRIGNVLQLMLKWRSGEWA